MRNLISSLFLLVAAMPAFAVDPVPLPEPGSFALVGIAAVAGIAVYLRSKRKK